MRIFPGTPGTTNHCVLAEATGPGLSRRIKATCRTATSVGAAGPVVVTFTETWPWKSFHASGSPRRKQHHWWRFEVEGPRGRGRIILVKEHGDLAPQSTE
jgi:hypothetical protein